MKKLIKSFAILLSILIFTQSIGVAMENKIKFDKETFYLSNPNSKNQIYNYYTKNENIENWHTKIFVEELPNLTNPTEVSAEFAHKIQEETKGASVLLYPDAAMTAYITFPPTKEYYEYNTVVFKPSKTKGLIKFGVAKKFKSSELGGQEKARKSAIDFAEKNTKKYMEMIDKSAEQMKF